MPERPFAAVARLPGGGARQLKIYHIDALKPLKGVYFDVSHETIAPFSDLLLQTPFVTLSSSFNNLANSRVLIIFQALMLGHIPDACPLR